MANSPRQRRRATPAPVAPAPAADGPAEAALPPRKRRTKEPITKLHRDLSKNIDKLIDLLPKNDVEQLFQKQLLKPNFRLQSFMLDRASKIGFERRVQFERPYECYRTVGEPGAEKYALYRLDSEGVPRFVDYIDGTGGLHACG